MFCPKCGSLLKPKRDDGKRIMVCSCGFKEGNIAVAKIKDVLRESKGLDVVDIEQGETLPLTDSICEKCGHTKAYYWLTQTRASDEPETKFLRCQKCKHTTRDYS